MEANFVNLTNFDFIDDNDDIKVFALEAPLSLIPKKIINELERMMITLNGYHTGIGFIIGNKSLIIDYTAVYGMGGCFLPDEKELCKGNLVWANNSYIEVGNQDEQKWSNDQGYWKHSSYLTTINKKQFLSLRNSILDEFLVKNPYYVFFGVKSNTAGQILRDSICDSLLTFVIKTLQNPEINAEFNFLTYPYLSKANLITSKPVKMLDVKNEDDKKSIVDFYQKIYGVLNFKKNDLINRFVSKFPWLKYSQKYLLNHVKFNQVLLSEIFKGLKEIILYSYDNMRAGTLVYYKVSVDDIEIKYAEMNLPRNLHPIEVNTQNNLSDLRSLSTNKLGSKNVSNMSLVISIILVILVCILLIWICFKCVMKKTPKENVSVEMK
jgi:hypothetical protein